MTLLLSMLTEQQAVLIADRRLTYADGSRRDTQVKLSTVTFSNARFGVGFTGLAEAPGFKAESWLLEAFAEAGPPDFTAPAALQRLQAVATKRFRTVSVRDPYTARLSLIITGFIYEGGIAHAVSWRLSNYERENEILVGQPTLPEFVVTGVRLRPTPEEPRPATIMIGGVLDLIPKVELEHLGKMLARPSSTVDIIRKGVSVIRNAAASPRAKQTIGSDLLSLVVPAATEGDPISQYHPEADSPTTYAANQALVNSAETTMLLMQPTFWTEGDGTSTMARGKTRRNAPCPCGSGLKFKRCHGR